MKRYHMHKNGWMAEDIDRAQLERLRRLNPQYFKYARIKEVLQLKPSEVPLGEPIRMKGW